MNILAEIVAQAAPLESHSVLFTYGPMGVMLAWFMWISNAVAKQVMATMHETGVKMDAIIHKLNGLRMALLVNTISSEKTSDSLRKFCEEELARANGSSSDKDAKP